MASALDNVVQKLVKFNPGLNINRSIFSCVKSVFAAHVSGNLGLLELKTEGQKVYMDNLTEKIQNWNQNTC